MNIAKKIIFILIISLAIFVRFYKLGKVPMSISWDEAAVGYNAYTIAHWGRDEWGKTLPLVFKSFEDYKHPVHIYLTVPTIATFGLTEFGVRASAAIFGVLNVVVIFFLARKIFKSDLAAYFASFFLAISPYNIQFSRFNHELNFAVFFFMLGCYLILLGLEKKNYLLSLGFASLGLDLLTYHSAKIIVPPIFSLLVIFYSQDLIKLKKYFMIGVALFLVFVGIIITKPELLGGARLSQTSGASDRTITALTSKYFSHFSYNYLVVQGDKNPRHSAQTGEFYKIDLLFLLVGLISLVLGIIKKNKNYLILFAWAILAPIPAAITSEAPHAARAMFTVGSWHLVSGLGAATIINIVNNKYAKIFLTVMFIVLIGLGFSRFWKYYFGEYATRYAIEWQYGMKQVAQFSVDNPQYYRVYVDKIRQQPYIFFLFYLKTPLPEFLSSVKYDESESKSYNTVASFDKYKFGTWDPIESTPNQGILYAITPSYYTGLRHATKFDLKYKVEYPNGEDAFYLVSGNE